MPARKGRHWSFFIATLMTKHETEEAQILYDSGQTFYGIAYQLKMWFSKNYTEQQIKKALGNVKNNPVGHQN